MDHEIKAKWVEALRSGKYKQGKGFLKYHNYDLGTDSYCCLGVLCEILNVHATYSQQEPESRSIGFGDQYDTAYLPHSVRNRVGLVNFSDQLNLSQRNDSGDWDFNSIADYIQENL